MHTTKTNMNRAPMTVHDVSFPKAPYNPVSVGVASPITIDKKATRMLVTQIKNHDLP